MSSLTAQSEATGHVTASFDVRNTGKVAGVTVAQIYVSQNNPSVPRPAKELKGYSRVELAPGEQKHLSIELDPRSFAYFNPSTASGRQMPALTPFCSAAPQRQFLPKP